jgi:hypothetical protein
MAKQNPNKVGKSKATVIPKMYDWGIYAWKLSNGRWFTDGQGNVLNIPSHRGDLQQMSKLRETAAHYGQPDGEAVFFPGLKRVSEETYSEQLDRMLQGLIPNMDDLGAVHAAQETVKQYGDEA